jgi:mannose-6-phosphate isomerase-like protein (cupin superfamily)
VHSREDEVSTGVRGHYRFRHGDVELDAPAGTTVYMPKGEPHVFNNIGTEPGEHLATLIPGGLEKMFREVSAAGLQMQRDNAKLDEFFAKYGLKRLPPSSLPLSNG